MHFLFLLVFSVCTIFRQNGTKYLYCCQGYTHYQKKDACMGKCKTLYIIHLSAFTMKSNVLLKLRAYKHPIYQQNKPTQ